MSCVVNPHNLCTVLSSCILFLSCLQSVYGLISNDTAHLYKLLPLLPYVSHPWLIHINWWCVHSHRHLTDTWHHCQWAGILIRVIRFVYGWDSEILCETECYELYTGLLKLVCLWVSGNNSVVLTFWSGMCALGNKVSKLMHDGLWVTDELWLCVAAHLSANRGPHGFFLLIVTQLPSCSSTLKSRLCVCYAVSLSSEFCSCGSQCLLWAESYSCHQDG
jgi:hypothetical protein